jgi:hypothetical protein
MQVQEVGDGAFGVSTGSTWRCKMQCKSSPLAGISLVLVPIFLLVLFAFLVWWPLSSF